MNNENTQPNNENEKNLNSEFELKGGFAEDEAAARADCSARIRETPDKRNTFYCSMELGEEEPGKGIPCSGKALGFIAREDQEYFIDFMVDRFEELGMLSEIFVAIVKRGPMRGK